MMNDDDDDDKLWSSLIDLLYNTVLYLFSNIISIYITASVLLLTDCTIGEPYAAAAADDDDDDDDDDDEPPPALGVANLLVLGLVLVLVVGVLDERFWGAGGGVSTFLESGLELSTGASRVSIASLTQ